jgi:hypothetical protein
MRALSAMLFGFVLLAPRAHAEPLPAGKPAGVRQASLGSNGPYLVTAAGISILVIGLGMAASKSSTGT